MSFARLMERSRALVQSVRRRVRRARRAVGVRLTAGYVLLLAVSMALLFGLAYWQMERALQVRDRSVIEAELQELKRDYDEDGLAAVEEEAFEELTGPGGRPLYLRLADPTGQTLFVRSPGAPGENPAGVWPLETLRRLKAMQTSAGEALPRWIRVAAGEDEETLEVAVRRLPDGNFLQMGASVEPRAEVMEEFRSTFLLAALPVLLLGLLGGLLLARQVLRPLRELALVARRIAATGELAARVPVRGSSGQNSDESEGGDELDALARLFNDMLARVERLVEGMRETLDHVAHDLRTPMTRLRGRGELVLQDETASEETYREALSDTLEAAAQVRSILDAIMEEAEARSGTLPLRPERCSLRTLADEVVDLYDYVAEERGVALGLQGEATALVDRGRMRQAVANLVDNAIKYTPPGGAVLVEVSAACTEGTTTGGHTGPVIQVRDTGPGIAEDDAPRIWDRLYRGDRSRTTRGLGLGLSLVQSIVEAHGATVAVESTPGEGAVFTIRLPGAS